jgi:isopenicillin N synthase-like dioxygenase
MNSTNDQLVRIDYNDLFNFNTDLSDKISQAFGIDGFGLIAVKNIPNYPEVRKKILNQGFTMANYDQDYLQTLERPDSIYSIGWQKGKTYFSGVWESMTGAFCARIGGDVMIHSDIDMQKRYMNVWPEEQRLPGFKEDILGIGELLTHCTENLLYHIDKYTQKSIPGYKEKNLYNRLKARNETIARLIMYYPAKTFNEQKYGKDSKDNWCTWHRDFGVLTALTHPIYYKEDGTTVSGLKSGLIIRDRKNMLHDVLFDEDEIVIQSGDTAFIETGGCIISTPHCVKITDDIPRDVFRVTLANFYDPCYEEVINLPEGINQDKIYERDPLGMEFMLTKFREPCTYETLVTNAYNTYHSKEENHS